MSDVIVAVIAAAASVVAAITAGLFALASRRTEARLQRSRQTHDRNSERKRERYEPVVAMLEHMFTSNEPPTDEELRHKQHFDTWVNVFGSDGVVRAYSRLLQGFASSPPPDIQFRLYADFLLEIRRDIGDPGSALDRVQLLGPRLAELSDPASLTDPDLEAVCARQGWKAPWTTHT